MNMRSIKNRLLLKGRKNKQTIITILLTLVAMAGQAQIHYRRLLLLLAMLFATTFGMAIIPFSSV